MHQIPLNFILTVNTNMQIILGKCHDKAGKQRALWESEKIEIRFQKTVQNSTVVVVGCLPASERRTPVLVHGAESPEAAMGLGESERVEAPVEAVAVRRNQTRIGPVAQLVGDVANFSVRSVGQRITVIKR